MALQKWKKSLRKWWFRLYAMSRTQVSSCKASLTVLFFLQLCAYKRGHRLAGVLPSIQLEFQKEAFSVLGLYNLFFSHYYRMLNCSGQFWFSAAGKRVRRGEKVTVNRESTAAGASARCSKPISSGGHFRTSATVKLRKKTKKTQSPPASPYPEPASESNPNPQP